MSLAQIPAPIIVLNPDIGEARQIASWLRSAGLGAMSTARTSDEAIFMLGRRSSTLLIIDERVSERSERRLLQHMHGNGHTVTPALVRLVGELPLDNRRPTTEFIQKPLVDHDVVLKVGSAIQRPDLINQLDRDRDQTQDHLEAAQRMQIGLLPTSRELHALQENYRVGVAALYRSGDAVGGDFWGIWPIEGGRIALAIADFAGHGLSAALNTFRLHALLSEQTLPRDQPQRMITLLNERLNALLPRGQYATMIYLVLDPVRRHVAWCSAGGPHPIVVSPRRQITLEGTGLPLGIKANARYQSHEMELPEFGVLSVFSDGLFESGADMPDVPQEAIARALTRPAEQAATGQLTAVAQEATQRLALLRDSYLCPNHSDDIMAICVAFAPA